MSRFNIKNYSTKIQRKYAALVKHDRDTNSSLARVYRESLKANMNTTRGAHRSSFKALWKRGRHLMQTETTLGGSALVFKNGGVTAPINDRTDWLGIEIECAVDMRKIPESISNNYYGTIEKVAKFLEAERCMYFTVKSDGSLRSPAADDRQSWGLVEITLVCRRGNYTPIDRVCAALNKLGARVNSKCGLHVHLDARHIEPEQVENAALKLHSALPLMVAMQSPQRRLNKYCSPVMNTTEGGGYVYKMGAQRKVFEPLGTERYAAINVQAYRRHKTVEVRIHSGTTNADKIKHWCELLSTVWTSREIAFGLDALELIMFFNFSENLQDYCFHRVALFSGSAHEIMLKNRVGVPFVDDDTEEVISKKYIDLHWFTYAQKQLEAVSRLASVSAQDQAIYDLTCEAETKLNHRYASTEIFEAFSAMCAEKSKALLIKDRTLALMFAEVDAQLKTTQNRADLDGFRNYWDGYSLPPEVRQKLGLSERLAGISSSVRAYAFAVADKKQNEFNLTLGGLNV